MKQILIACSMMEDEINHIYKEIKCEIPIIWVERGYHNTPAKLMEKLQSLIDDLQDYEEILLTFGLCGNGTEGIVSKRATLVLPKFDDCINMLLCSGQRKTRGLTDSGNIYLTRGWTLDSESILGQYEKTVADYDEETATAVMEMMYEHYESIALIDTGCYDLAPVQAYAQKAADLLDLSTQTVKGSTCILKQLLLGQWDENFIIQKPGLPLSASQWELPVGN